MYTDSMHEYYLYITYNIYNIYLYLMIKYVEDLIRLNKHIISRHGPLQSHQSQVERRLAAAYKRQGWPTSDRKQVKKC